MGYGATEPSQSTPLGGLAQNDGRGWNEFARRGAVGRDESQAVFENEKAVDILCYNVTN